MDGIRFCNKHCLPADKDIAYICSNAIYSVFSIENMQLLVENY